MKKCLIYAMVIHLSYKNILSLGTAEEPMAPLQKNRSAAAMQAKSSTQASFSAVLFFGCIFCILTASFPAGSMHPKFQKLALYLA